MSGSEVRRIRERLGLTQGEFARLLGVHKVTVAKWEVEMRSPRGTAETLIRLVAKIAPKRPARRNSGRRRLK